MCAPQQDEVVANGGLCIPTDGILSSDGMIGYYKVLPCTRKTKHDWSCCFYSHPGEKARRRSPLQNKYSSVLCLDMMRKGHCQYGDDCKLAHSVFEYWLHPDKYRTKMCKDGDNCDRVVCFFAHSLEELRTPPSSVPPNQISSTHSTMPLASFSSSDSSGSCGTTFGPSGAGNSQHMVFSTSSFEHAVACLPAESFETSRNITANGVELLQIPQPPQLLQYAVQGSPQQQQMYAAAPGSSSCTAGMQSPVRQIQQIGNLQLQHQSPAAAADAAGLTPLTTLYGNIRPAGPLSPTTAASYQLATYQPISNLCGLETQIGPAAAANSQPQQQQQQAMTLTAVPSSSITPWLTAGSMLASSGSGTVPSPSALAASMGSLSLDQPMTVAVSSTGFGNAVLQTLNQGPQIWSPCHAGVNNQTLGMIAVRGQGAGLHSQQQIGISRNVNMCNSLQQMQLCDAGQSVAPQQQQHQQQQHQMWQAAGANLVATGPMFADAGMFDGGFSRF